MPHDDGTEKFYKDEVEYKLIKGYTLNGKADGEKRALMWGRERRERR